MGKQVYKGCEDYKLRKLLINYLHRIANRLQRNVIKEEGQERLPQFLPHQFSNCLGFESSWPPNPLLPIPPTGKQRVHLDTQLQSPAGNGVGKGK